MAPRRRWLVPWIVAAAVWASALLGAPLTAGAAPIAAPSAARRPAKCTDDERREVLRRIQTDVLNGVPADIESFEKALHEDGPLAGWKLSHGHVVLAGAGGVAVENLGARPPLPQVLVYAPRASSAPESWLDFDGEDGPYRLVGWYLAEPYRPGSHPPQRPCLAAPEWYVHEAGWHLMNGGMVLTPGATAEPPRPDLDVYFWHPRVWDVHFWMGDDGVPEVTLHNPQARRGGLDLPRGAFFRIVGGHRQDAPPPYLP